MNQENNVKIRINIFQENGKFDNNAIGAGIYMVELSKDSENPRLQLYIGQSIYMLKRCGEHLYELSKKPEYFGLTYDILENENFILHFTVLKSLTSITDKISMILKEKEKRYINELKPLAQRPNSDRLIKERVDIVKSKISEFWPSNNK